MLPRPHCQKSGIFSNVDSDLLDRYVPSIEKGSRELELKIKTTLQPLLLKTMGAMKASIPSI